MSLITDAYDAKRQEFSKILEALSQLTNELNHEEMVRTVEDLQQRIHEPFMFVIVGEVKSGKSSFINALLAPGQEICKVSPAPMTDKIQEIVYSETEKEELINPYLVKVSLAIPILKDIAIVDTPGTNTIVEHHQEITERFIPSSDLIVFVFEAKNPYRQSAWDFFQYIHDEWRRKIIFVLQQKDLMNEEDLETNRKGLYSVAMEKGVKEPRIFAVSAKSEIEGQTG